MINRENLSTLVERAMQGDEYKHMRPVIEKELILYDILFSLDKHGLLDQLTFQGGTALRLCYGASRFSEDLGFVGGAQFVTADLMNIKACIELYIGEKYGLETRVKEPAEMSRAPEHKDVKVDKWQVRITTSPEKKEFPKQKIKLEVANVPAYSRVPQSLQKNYDFLPDGYGDILVMTETLDEIMADKLVSLVCCQRYIRNRDIWDLCWLSRQGAKINTAYVLSKIKDYREENYEEKLTFMIKNIDGIVRSKNFQDEIKRFIPIDVQERTILKEKFIDFLVIKNKGLLQEVKRRLHRAPQDDEFML
jgi:predicted nucleotidyltransferase component of viral defense system